MADTSQLRAVLITELQMLVSWHLCHKYFEFLNSYLS